MQPRWIASLALIMFGAIAACSDDADQLSRQDCEAVIAHLIVLEKAGGETAGPMCKYHGSCDGTDRRLFLNNCPRAITPRQARCYQRAVTVADAEDCLPLADLDARIQTGGRGDGYGYGHSTFLGTGGKTRPEDRALRDLTTLRDDACRCRDTDCATLVENRFQDLARRLGDLDQAPGLRDHAQRIAEEAMKCLVAAMVPPDAGPPPDGAPFATGMPNCDRYLAAMEAYMNCDQFPASSRDSVRESIETMRKSYADYATLPDSTRQSVDDACNQAIDSIRQSASSLGCTIP